MNKRLLFFGLLAFGVVDGMIAQDSGVTASAASSVPAPLVLEMKEKIQDSTQYKFPLPPRKNAEGTPLDLDNDGDNPPQGPDFSSLADSLDPGKIESLIKADKNSGKYYWHPFKNWSYCHYREGDRQWIGWRTGETFHWILWRSGRFWWRDDYAERWIYWDQDYWWWRNPKPPNQFQAFLSDRHYHSCDAQGILGDDLMRTGTEEVVTEPGTKPNPTPGEKKGGRRGGHRGGGAGMGGNGQSGMGGD